MSGRTYASVEEMLDDIDPEFAVDFRKHINKPSVRFRQWRTITWFMLKLRVMKFLGLD